MNYGTWNVQGIQGKMEEITSELFVCLIKNKDVWLGSDSGCFTDKITPCIHYRGDLVDSGAVLNAMGKLIDYKWVQDLYWSRCT